MSTYLYLQCLDHNPPLLSTGEVGIHLHALPRIRNEIGLRNLFVANREAGIGNVYDSNFTTNAARFLCQHPRCRIGIVDEYGREHHVEDQ